MLTAYYLYSTRYAVYDPETCVFQYYLCAQDAETDKKRQGGVVVVSTLLYKERFGFGFLNEEKYAEALAGIGDAINKEVTPRHLSNLAASAVRPGPMGAVPSLHAQQLDPAALLGERGVLDERHLADHQDEALKVDPLGELLLALGEFGNQFTRRCLPCRSISEYIAQYGSS